MQLSPNGWVCGVFQTDCRCLRILNLTRLKYKMEIFMKREIALNGVRVADDTDAYVIAEIGHNHQGSVETAMKMIKIAASCGANAVKLQKRNNKTLFTKELYNTPYDNENSYGSTYGAHREALEFSKEEYRDLIRYAMDEGITLFATPFDFESVDFLEELDIPLYKIASGDLTNTPLQEYIARLNKPIILSTGGGTLDSVRRARDAILKHNNRLAILQCTAAYPVYNYEDLNIRVISTYRDEFPEQVIGMSDHESGYNMAIGAYVLGARIIEKHFTLNRAWRGTDHAFSLAPSGLKRLVRGLKRVRLALGSAEKMRLDSEVKPLFKMEKKLVAARDLEKGHLLKRDDVAIKSPGDGLPPFELNNVLGKVLLRDLREDENVSFDDLSEQ